MKLSVSKDLLRQAVFVASRALSKTVVLVERSHLLFKVSGGVMRISGTNNDLKALCIVPMIESEGEVTFTADPKILDKLLSKIDMDTIKIDFDQSNLTLRIYTSQDESSFNTIQSFPPEKMLSVSDQAIHGKTYPVSREILLRALKYAINYLEKANEEKKNYDFVIINDKIVFAANGLNKMGYFVVQNFKDIQNIKIRKQAVPMFIAVLDKIPQDTVVLGETDNDVMIGADDLNIYFSCLKSTIEAPKIDLNYIKINGPFVEVNRVDLDKKITRLFATTNSAIVSGLNLTLSGAGDTAYLDIASLSNLKAKERVSCKRVDDASTEDIGHIIDYKLFTAALDSFIGDNLRLHLSDLHLKMSEIVKEDKDGETMKYITVGIGSYSKVKSKT